MSFTTETSKLILVGDGVKTVFPYNYLIYDDAHLAVYLDGVRQSTGYTVDGVGNALGGNVTFNTAPAAGVVVTLNLEVPFTQELSYTQGGKFPSASHEKGLDLNTMLCRRLNEVDSRALRVPQGGASTEDTELPSQTDRASKYLAFDTDGNPVATAGTTSDIVATPFMETVLDDTTGNAALETIITDLTAETAPAVGDLVPISDVSAVSGRKITLQNLLKVINSLTEDTAPDKSADFVLTYDTSASAVKKAKPINVDVLPSGVIAPYGGSTAPTGWLECDGSAVSRTTYANLFAAISTTWGAGDESTTFNLPPSAGRGFIGRGTGTVTVSGVDSGVDLTTDTLATPPNNAKWFTGMPVVFTLTSGTITPLTSGNTYYIVRIGGSIVRLADSLANAQHGVVIDMTAKANPVWTLTHTYTTRSLGETGGEQEHAMSSTELLSHTHTLTNGTSVIRNAAGSGATGGADKTTNNITAQSTGGNAAMNIQDPFLAVMYIIKT